MAHSPYKTFKRLTKPINKSEPTLTKKKISIKFLDTLNQAIHTSENPNISVSRYLVNVKNLTGIPLTKEFLSEIVKNSIEKLPLPLKIEEKKNLVNLVYEENLSLPEISKNISVKEKLMKTKMMDSNLPESQDVFNIEDFIYNEQLLFEDNLFGLDSELVQEENELFPDTNECTEVDVPNLTDLPLEDFISIDSFINSLEDDQQDSDVLSDILENVDEVFDSPTNTSDSMLSSPYMDQEMEAQWKDFLDSMDESSLVESVNTLQNDVQEINSLNLLDEVLCKTETISSSEDICVNNSSTIDFFADNILNLLSTEYGVCEDTQEELTRTPNRALKRKDTCDIEHTVIKQQKTSCKSESDSTDKAVLRRIKNNAASRVTRAKRKDKHTGLYQKEIELKKSNAEMKIKIEAMQKDASLLRELLISKLSGVNSN